MIRKDSQDSMAIAINRPGADFYKRTLKALTLIIGDRHRDPHIYSTF